MLSLEEAIASLEQMPLLPSVENFMWILRKCSKKKNVVYARRLHAYMRETGLEGYGSLGNYLVLILAQVGSMRDAQEGFNRLVDRNVYSWTSLIMGYIECGESQRALNLYQKMQEDYVHPSKYTFVALLKACARLNDAAKGREIYAEIARKGLERDIFVGSTLVDMYAKCGSLSKAQEAFNKLPIRNEVSWNVLITGYCEHGFGEEALDCLKQMQLEGVSPNVLTFVCSLKACGSIRAVNKGREIHVAIGRMGLERDPFVGNILVDMYAKCGSFAKAREVFDKLPVQDVVSWNALITGYTQHGLAEESLNCFAQMQLEGVSPNALTIACSLKACGSIGAIDKGQKMHTDIARRGMEMNLFVGSTLVDMYAKVGSIARAQEVFDKLPTQDVVAWTALIAGYAEQGLGEEALFFFEQMQLERIPTDALTFVCSLKACGCIGAVDKGQEMHAKIARKALEQHPFVGNSLIDMYSKCGSLAKAQEVFDKLQLRDVVSWNILIAGYAQLGESEIVFHMLVRMKREGLKPDGFTFLSILTLCSHTGLVDNGQKYFETMIEDYGIPPSVEHHTCMIDLLGRAGQLDELIAMVKKMPVHPNLSVWHTVLGACQKWGDVEHGRQAFEHGVQLDEKDAAVYVLMSNIYADSHMQEDVNKLEGMRMKEQALKMSIDVGGIERSFSLGIQETKVHI